MSEHVSGQATTNSASSDNAVPMDLPKVVDGLRPEVFFGLFSCSSLAQLLQIFAYYVRYAGGRADLSAVDIARELTPLARLHDLEISPVTIAEALVTNIDSGVIVEINPGSFALTYHGDLDAGAMIGDQAQMLLWPEGWQKSWANSIGSKTDMDRLVAYAWYLEQCNRSEPMELILVAAEAEGALIATPITSCLDRVIDRGWISKRKHHIYALTEAGRQRVQQRFPSLRSGS